MGLKMHTFRPVADGAFFPTDMFERFRKGEFAKEFERRGLELLIGEVRDEVSSAIGVTDMNRLSIRFSGNDL